MVTDKTSIPLRLTLNGLVADLTDAQVAACVHIDRLQNEKNVDIMVVLFDTQRNEFRFWVNGQRAGIVKV